MGWGGRGTVTAECRTPDNEGGGRRDHSASIGLPRVKQVSGLCVGLSAPAPQHPRLPAKVER